jgi:DNA-binding beta-propeller fold protein YncE
MRVPAPVCAAAIFAVSFARAQTPIELPGGSSGIGFDDLRFAPALGAVLVPAGRTGALVLLDPASRGMTPISGFSAKAGFSGGHDDGVTSADEGQGWIFATDRTSGTLDVVDPRSRKIVSRVKLGGPPDYVRFVPATGEIWVTHPDREGIEIFRLPAGSPPAAAHEGFVSVPGGPESLVVDGKRGRAYTNLWKGKTVAIDVRARAVAATWENGCKDSRGIALDASGRFLFVGCAEGKAVVLDTGNGKSVSNVASGNGVDIIDYDATLSHLYLPGGKSATMAVLGVSRQGKLSLLGTVPTAAGAHCVAAANGSVFVCDPKKGRLIVFRDRYPVPGNGRGPVE